MPAVPAEIWLALMCLASIGLTLALRAARAPGGVRVAAILGGAAAGIILGPSVAGRAFPDAIGPVFHGSPAAATQLRTYDREREVERTALLTTGVSGVALEEFDQQTALEREPLEEKATAAADGHRLSLLMVPAFVAVLLVMFGPTHTWASSRRGVRRQFKAIGAPRQWVPAMMAPLIVATIAWTFAWLTLGVDQFTAVAVGAIFGVPAFASTQRPPINIGSLLAALLLTIAAIATGTAGVFAAAVIGACVAGKAFRGRMLRIQKFLGDGVLLPMLAATIFTTIDLHTLSLPSAFAWIWLAVLAVIVSSDARWIVGWILLAAARTPSTALRSSSVLDAGAGVAQLVLCAVCLPSGDIPPEISLAAVLGAVVVEGSRGIRESVAWRLDGAAERPEPSDPTSER